MSIINDLERIADICYQMSKVIEKKSENKIYFTPDQRDNLKNMLDLVDRAIIHMENGLKINAGAQDLIKANELEDAINKYRNSLRNEYLEDVTKGTYQIHSGIVYNDLFSSMEKMGDHIINVSEALALNKTMGTV